MIWLKWALLAGLVMGADEAPDLVLADFEGVDYGDWKATGAAFGPGPARGALPGQMPVSGFLGKGLVNSFVGGDRSIGELTSPSFIINRPYLNFLIGGGGYAGQTCINLLVDGKPVRTATGPNLQAGGSEELEPAGWDVREFAGKSAVVQIIDHATGGWGHINIDQIVLSSKLQSNAPQRRQFQADQAFLHLPVKTGARKQTLKITDGQRVFREFEIEITDETPDFWAAVDLTSVKGKRLTLEGKVSEKSLSQARLADHLPEGASLYVEPERPQFHFTSRRGWLNDPNGLVFANGVYHLFYQHNPYGWNWGNMHWGHATSKDLVTWVEEPIALYPPRFGDWCFSGSAVVDHANTSGFQTGSAPPIVAAFTSTGRGECIVSSNDNGKTWTEFARNPVVKHNGRDPKLIWHEPSRQWIMAVYEESNGRAIAFHASKNLCEWTYLSRIEDFFECPDLFEIKTDTGESKWILYGADGKYLIGHFDGKAFHKESGKHQLWHGQFYAAQTFDNEPSKRRVQIGWANGVTFPGSAFNQQMTIACELTLRQTTAGLRLFAEPVRELAALRTKTKVEAVHFPAKGAKALANDLGDLLDVEATIEPTDAIVTLSLGKTTVRYDGSKQTIHVNNISAPAVTGKNPLRLRILLDRGSIEVFGLNAPVAISSANRPAGADLAIAVTATGSAKIDPISMASLRSIWSAGK